MNESAWNNFVFGERRLFRGNFERYKIIYWWYKSVWKKYERFILNDFELLKWGRRKLKCTSKGDILKLFWGRLFHIYGRKMANFQFSRDRFLILLIDGKGSPKTTILSANLKDFSWIEKQQRVQTIRILVQKSTKRVQSTNLACQQFCCLGNGGGDKFDLLGLFKIYQTHEILSLLIPSMTHIFVINDTSRLNTSYFLFSRFFEW